MARKETIYTVDAATDTILRASSNHQRALEFAATCDTVYLCTSPIQNQRRGDVIVEIEDVLTRF